MAQARGNEMEALMLALQVLAPANFIVPFAFAFAFAFLFYSPLAISEHRLYRHGISNQYEIIPWRVASNRVV